MPFINGKFYMNPAYGRAVESARRSGAIPNQNTARQSQTHDDADEDGHWVTINGQHVLIDGSSQAQNPAVRRHPRQSAEKTADQARQTLPSSGQASIYADKFNGRKTANGEIFDQNGYTVALLPRIRWHAVPLGTHVELTHDGTRIVVEVNERGKGDSNSDSARVLDLSHAAASALTGRAVNDDDDAFAVGVIRLDKIKVLLKDTPLGPVVR
jgi:rare lipoprotein A